MKDKFENDKLLYLYMKEVGEDGVLSKDEERELFEDIDRYKSSKKPSKQMRAKYDLAKEKLIKSNLKLVIKIAKEYRNLGLDFPDLINEGNLGLMNAVEKFDSSKGTKLSYYASFWIKQSIRRSISNKGRTIRLPVAVVDSKLKINKFIEQYTSDNNKEPTAKQISVATKMPLKKVLSLTKLSLSSPSLDEKVDEESDKDLMSTIEDDHFDSPIVRLMITDDENILNKLLGRLPQRERYIIIHRFGLGGRETKTLEVIGQEFNLTRERIRQLEISALEKLRDMYKKIK